MFIPKRRVGIALGDREREPLVEKRPRFHIHRERYACSTDMSWLEGATMCKRAFSSVFWVFLAVAIWSTSIHADTRAGLVGYWPLDGDATDASVSVNDGTVVGNVTASPDRYSTPSGALLFPGEADSYVDVGDQPELQIAGGMTLAAWVYLRGFNENSGCVISKQGGGDRESWGLGVAAEFEGVANPAVFQVASSGSDPIRVADALPLPTDRWVHLAGIYRPGAAIEIYVDGQLRVSSAAGVPGSQFSDNGVPVLIGSRDGCLDCGWDGLIDEARVYDRAVSQVEIWQIMRSNVGLSLSPEPADRATNVPRDVTLRWTAGLFAKSHDVYLGTVATDVNDASRTDPRGVLVSQGAGVTKYAPSSFLNFGQTYYWRVDEVNAPPNSTIYKGNVWSFTVEPVAQTMVNIVATSNAISNDGEGPQRTVDGSGLDADDHHSIMAADMWLGVPDGGDPVWIQYQFDMAYKLDEMLIWNYNAESELDLGFGLKDVTVEYSTDGVVWSALRDVEVAQATAAPDYAANTTVALGGVAARYIRLIVHSTWGATGECGLSEVRFLSIPTRARNPRPANGETGVDVDLILGWSAGREAELHDVHLSDSGPMVATGAALKGTVTANWYALKPLDFGTPYYWRVDEINESRTPRLWQGEIWTFTTREYAMVDDFEVYNDDVGRRIYQIWHDGWNNGTGSTVGYLEAPFAEKIIVHGGGQSMPFAYNNAEAPFYSEAVRNLAIEQNWLGHGADTLRLFVRGNADNDPGTLYFAVTDSIGRVAVSTHPDPTVPTRVTWEEWLVPFSDFDGVSLGRIQSIHIGVGDRDNPVMGGSGLIYIDDIEYGHSTAGSAPVRR